MRKRSEFRRCRLNERREACGRVFLAIGHFRRGGGDRRLLRGRGGPTDVGQARRRASTVYANSADIAEGKRLAEASCAGCHGSNGINTNPGVPNLAGQRAGVPLSRAEGLPVGCARRQRHDQHRQVPERRGAGPGRRLFRQSRSRPTHSVERRRRSAGRSRSSREDGGGGLRGMPRRDRHQQDARHAEPGRARSEISRRGHEGLQDRPAQERHDEVDAGDAPRCER